MLHIFASIAKMLLKRLCYYGWWRAKRFIPHVWIDPKASPLIVPNTYFVTWGLTRAASGLMSRYSPDTGSCTMILNALLAKQLEKISKVMV